MILFGFDTGKINMGFSVIDFTDGNITLLKLEHTELYIPKGSTAEAKVDVIYNYLMRVIKKDNNHEHSENPEHQNNFYIPEFVAIEKPTNTRFGYNSDTTAIGWLIAGVLKTKFPLSTIKFVGNPISNFPRTIKSSIRKDMVTFNGKKYIQQYQQKVASYFDAKNEVDLTHCIESMYMALSIVDKDISEEVKAILFDQTIPEKHRSKKVKEAETDLLVNSQLEKPKRTRKKKNPINILENNESTNNIITTAKKPRKKKEIPPINPDISNVDIYESTQKSV